jgi:hypothetical protein
MHVDDASAALLTHVRRNSAREPNRAHQIYFEAIPPFLVGRIQRMTQPSIAGVIHQDIDAAEFRYCSINY